MKFYKSGQALARDMGISVSVLEATMEAHYQAAEKTEEDPDGGPWPAYPSGKSWDEPSGKTGAGKKFYTHVIPGSAVKTEPFYVAIITPVIHYCMGGLEIDTNSACIGSNGEAIQGLYAAGEVAGGVHGENMLGGNSLLDAVVFGRIAALSACKSYLGSEMESVDLKELSGNELAGATAPAEGSKARRRSWLCCSRRAAQADSEDKLEDAMKKLELLEAQLENLRRAEEAHAGESREQIEKLGGEFKRIDAMEAKLGELDSHYTKGHPRQLSELTRAVKKIDDMEGQVAEWRNEKTKRKEVDSKAANAVAVAAAIRFLRDFAWHNTGSITEFYEMEEKQLGEGGFGKAFKAKDKSTNAESAIKVISLTPTLTSDRKQLENIRQEITFMTILNNPHVVKLYETFADDKNIYLVMELCSGGELFDRIEKAGHLTEALTAIVMSQMLSIIHYLHGNCICHRDIKCENFLLTSQDPIEDNNLLRIIDFGAAVQFDKGRVMKTKTGTLYYVAPEVLSGAQYDRMCDLWSCGVIMYIMLCGTFPFAGNNDNQTMHKVKNGKFDFEVDEWKNVSEDAKHLICMLLRKDPRERYTPEQAMAHNWMTMRDSPKKGSKTNSGSWLKCCESQSHIASSEQIPNDFEEEDVKRCYTACVLNPDGKPLGLLLNKSCYVIGVEAGAVLDYNEANQTELFRIKVGDRIVGVNGANFDKREILDALKQNHPKYELSMEHLDHEKF